MEKSKKILKVENLKKAYYSTSRTGESITYPVLNNVSFEIEEGEFVKELLNRACEVQRVAGAWAALIAGPTVMSAIDIVYETEVDEFDNEELYTQGAYFILRAIMKMHGTEI